MNKRNDHSVESIDVRNKKIMERNMTAWKLAYKMVKANSSIIKPRTTEELMYEKKIQLPNVVEFVRD